MDERQVTTGLEGSEPQSPITMNGKNLCKICKKGEVQPGKEICWCCEDPASVIYDQLARLKAIGLSIISIAYAGGGKELESIPYITDPWGEIEELGTMILEQESKIREVLSDRKKAAH